jgi:hypothetical protein
MTAWMVFVLASLGLALAALRFTLFGDKTGWTGMNYLGMFLIVWLPLVSATTLALLCALAVRSGVRWTTVAALGLLLGGVQFALIAYTNNNRLASSFLPLVLLALSSVALALRNNTGALPAAAWLERCAPLFALAGLVALGSVAILRR